jgi:hypothetical protein
MSFRLTVIVGGSNSSPAVANVCWADKGVQGHAGDVKEMLEDLRLMFVCV